MPPDEGAGAPPAGSPPETPPANGAAAPATKEQQVPLSRLTSVSKALEAAETRAATFEAEATALRATAAAAEAFRDRADRALQKYDNHFGIAKVLGQFEPDVIEMVETVYGKQPEDVRAKGLGVVVGEWKADPAKAPPSIRPHFVAPAITTNTSTREPVDPHKGVVQTQAVNAGERSAAEIRAMTDAEFIADSNARRAARGLPLHPVRK